jgi:thymidylate kinase
MIIVFDSYDTAGKTTLAKAYANKYGVKLYRDAVSQKPEFKSPNENRIWAQSGYTHLARLIASGIDMNFVMDRWIFTEHCYAPVLRGYDIKYYTEIENMIAATGKIVWVFPFVEDMAVLKERYKKHGEKFMTFKDLLKVKDNYEALFTNTKYPSISIDTSSGLDVVEPAINLIHKFVTHIGRQCWRIL